MIRRQQRPEIRHRAIRPDHRMKISNQIPRRANHLTTVVDIDSERRGPARQRREGEDAPLAVPYRRREGGASRVARVSCDLTAIVERPPLAEELAREGPEIRHHALLPQERVELPSGARGGPGV